MIDLVEETALEPEDEGTRPIRQSKSTLILVEEMTEHIPNKYEAVRAIAKEARNINSMYLMHGIAETGDKPTTMAIKRALEGKLSFDYGEGGEESPTPPVKAESDDEEKESEK